MSSTTNGAPSLTLPENPDLRHLRQQARDLITNGEATKLFEAQFQLARRYGFASWPKLKAHVDSLKAVGQLKAAIDADDLDTVKKLMTADPTLHRAPIGYNKDGPLTWVAECRIPGGPPTSTRLEMARWMIENGSDIHQGGDGPLMRASLSDNRIPMMELLVAHGADVNAYWNGSYPILLAPCESLQPTALRWLLTHGADPHSASPSYGSAIPMLVGTYARNADGKHACLSSFVEIGYDLPDTPVMALHRGRLDLLDAHFRRDSDLLDRRLTHIEMFPSEVGIKPGEGACSTTLEGGTLLHLAVELHDAEAVRWLLEQGADPNARATIDTDGFGGQTPIFHTVIVMGRTDDTIARLLLERGADPNARATLRRRFDWLAGAEGERNHDYREVTPIGYANRYRIQEWTNTPALTLIRDQGGIE